MTENTIKLFLNLSFSILLHVIIWVPWIEVEVIRYGNRLLKIGKKINLNAFRRHSRRSIVIGYVMRNTQATIIIAKRKRIGDSLILVNEFLVGVNQSLKQFKRIFVGLSLKETLSWL